MHPIQEKYESEITELVEVCHRAADRMYVTSHGGNLSWRVSDDELIITPTKSYKGSLSFDDIVIVGMDRNVRYASEGRRPTGELPIHVRLFEKRPDVRTIIHAHPAWMTAFALSKPELLCKPWLPEPITEVGPIALTEYATPLTEDLAQCFDPVIERYNAFLMRNHGMLLLCIEGMARCMELLDMMETTAKSVAIAEMMGGAQPLSDEQVSELDDILQIRKLPLPGAPGVVTSLRELFS